MALHGNPISPERRSLPQAAVAGIMGIVPDDRMIAGADAASSQVDVDSTSGSATRSLIGTTVALAHFSRTDENSCGNHIDLKVGITRALSGSPVGIPAIHTEFPAQEGDR